MKENGDSTVTVMGTLVVRRFAESLQARVEWLDKLKERRKGLNEEIKETEKALRKAINDAAAPQGTLPRLDGDAPQGSPIQ